MSEKRNGRRRQPKMDVPAGCERVVLVLPSHQAFIVKQWDAAEKERRARESAGNQQAETVQ
jgi:hypothetical protein